MSRSAGQTLSVIIKTSGIRRRYFAVIHGILPPFLSLLLPNFVFDFKYFYINCRYGNYVFQYGSIGSGHWQIDSSFEASCVMAAGRTMSNKTSNSRRCHRGLLFIGVRQFRRHFRGFLVSYDGRTLSFKA